MMVHVPLMQERGCSISHKWWAVYLCVADALSHLLFLFLQALLLELRKHHLPASGAASSTEDSTAVLQLLGVAANLVAKLAACEGLLRAALSELGSLVGSVGDNTQALDPVTLRLLASEVRLHHFLTPLPSTACAISALLSHCIVICVLSWGCKFRCTFLGAHPSICVSPSSPTG